MHDARAAAQGRETMRKADKIIFLDFHKFYDKIYDNR